MSESISQLPLATQVNATDLIPATQGSIGPGTGTTRAVTPAQIMAAPFTSTFTWSHPTVTDATAKGTGYEIEQDITYNLSATASGIFFGNEMNCVVNGNPQNSQIWNNLDRMFAETDSTASISLVNRYIQSVRPAGFGTPSQTMWCAVMELRDQTGLASSLAGGLLGLEIDIACNGLDDASKRQGLVITLLDGDGAGSGAPPQAARAIGIFNGGISGAGFLSAIAIAAPFLDAGLDFRFAGLLSGGANNGVWLRTSQGVAFDTAGNFRLSTDEATLNSSRKFRSDNGFQIGGADIISADGTTITTNVPFRPPNYTVATLPAMDAPHQGALAFATDARNTGEGGGSGTGCIVSVNHLGTWIAVWSGVAPTT